MLYTRKGDSGTSGLFGSTERLPKTSPVYEALGALDELNSLLGLCRAHARTRTQFDEPLARAQQCLFVLQAAVAGAPKKLPRARVEELEHCIDGLEAQAGNPHSFVLPGATEFSGLLDYARAVSRRAERRVLGLPPERTLGEAERAYLNRLSSLLYALARYAAALEGKTEEHPVY